MNGLIAVIEPIVFWITARWPWFATVINRILINGVVSSARSRPHPWSTKTPYISWAALSDKSYSSRFLPEAELQGLPDSKAAAALFDRLDGRQAECSKSTTLFPAFAQYLTDGFIRTLVSNDDALTDRRRNSTNHEIDLCPLYGRVPAQTNALRLKSQEIGRRGRLKSQTLPNGQEYPPALYGPDNVVLKEFEDLDSPLGLSKIPPETLQMLFAIGGDRANGTVGASMINTLLLREHNRVAGVIEAANPSWDDDRIFEVSRNVLIVEFIKIVVEEYINHISPARIPFIADPSGAWRAPWNKPNWISAEFSLLYRWHSLVPDIIRWGSEDMAMSNLRFANHVMMQVGLAECFVRMSAQPAASLGMGNTAAFLTDVEEKAILQARENKIASYGDYRAAMGLAPVKRWEDISVDPAIAARLATAYPGGVADLELYVGLFAEDHVANSPLPELILRMVAIDAFSQALTNPLLSENIWGNSANRVAAFTSEGLAAIETTRSLRDILVRNGADPGEAFVGMTRPGWKRNARLQKPA